MENPILLVEKKERVCTLTLNRPEKRNALSPLLLGELTAVLKRLTEEGEVRCVVIRGSARRPSRRALTSPIPIRAGAEEVDPVRAESPLDQGMQAVIDFPYPVIAMVNGSAFGAGCELAMTCDIRIAADHARFSVPPAKLGIVYRWRGGSQDDRHGRSWRLPRRCFLPAGPMMPPRPRRWGSSIMSSRAIDFPFTYEMAQEISENAPLSLRG